MPSVFEYNILMMVGSIIEMILQVRTPTHREVKRLAQDNTALESSSLVSEVYALPCSPVLPVLGKKLKTVSL